MCLLYCGQRRIVTIINKSNPRIWSHAVLVRPKFYLDSADRYKFIKVWNLFSEFKIFNNQYWCCVQNREHMYHKKRLNQLHPISFVNLNNQSVLLFFPEERPGLPYGLVATKRLDGWTFPPFQVAVLSDNY